MSKSRKNKRYRRIRMLLFNATTEQLQTVMANAYNASVPMGMGIVHFTPQDRKPSDFDVSKGIHADYVQGRMVKLAVSKDSNTGKWVCRSGKANIEYQSWASTYETYTELLESAGIDNIEVVGE